MPRELHDWEDPRIFQINTTPQAASEPLNSAGTEPAPRSTSTASTSMLDTVCRISIDASRPGLKTLIPSR